VAVRKSNNGTSAKIMEIVPMTREEADVLMINKKNDFN
jgi:hypothetical protein